VDEVHVIRARGDGGDAPRDRAVARERACDHARALGALGVTLARVVIQESVVGVEDEHGHLDDEDSTDATDAPRHSIARASPTPR
jgi:hypothetical protein